MQYNLAFKQIEDAFRTIGYKHSLIKKDYEYADLFSPGDSVPIRTVERAIFGQEPLDYRSACFGIRIVESNRPSSALASELKALGAPQIFILNNGITERWAITEHEPILKEKYRTGNLPNIITRNIKEWNPKAVLRAKSDFAKPAPQQMDFADVGLLPILESEAAKKIDHLLKAILNHTEQEFETHKLNINATIVFRAVFSLLAAKLLKDRDVLATGDIDFSLPVTALKAVSNHYGSSSPFDASKIPISILKSISQEIGDSFSLRNISVDTLTYIYENTFVSAENRQKLGIHSTPSYMADYVLSQIPLETLPKTRWHTTDPMSGHGIFLIAAMRRMRDLLPGDWSGKQRHNFYISHLCGIEIDTFSVEVARMCLMLADFPEPNGWNLKNTDVFTGKILEDTVANTMILIGNPPFENIEGRSPDIPKPVELLRRVLPALPMQALIGLVLPRSFIDGSDYKKQREMLLRNFELIALTDLPDRIFLHSDMETTIIVARKQQPRQIQNVIYREVKDNERDIFRTRHQVTREDKVPQSYFEDEMDGRFVVPLLRKIWEQSKHYIPLGKITDIRIGIQYKAKLTEEDLNKIIRHKPFADFMPGIYNISGGFYQYIAEDTIYLSTEKKFRRFEESKAWELPWDKPKIIVPASRVSRNAWRFSAAIDKAGRIVSRRFYCIWPKSETYTIQILAALLNSPIAEAFVYAHSFQRDIPKRVYSSIPLPDISDNKGYIIHSLVDRYLEAIKENDKGSAKIILLQIDAEVLKLYKLPPKLERQLLDIFWGYQRPVPFEFTGYIPIDVDSWIPLHVHISDKFREASPQKIMERIPVIRDKEFLDYFKSFGRE